MRPRIVPVGDDFGSGSDSGRESAGCTGGITGHTRKSRVLDWVVAVPFALDGRLAAGGVVRDEAFVGGASDVVG